ETIQRLSSRFLRLLSAIPGNPDRDIPGIDILTDDEKRQVLEEFNNTAMDYPTDKALHRLIEEQAEKTPDTIAVVGPGCVKEDMERIDIQLSYRRLNQRAGQIAAILIKKGVREGSIIGIMMKRSVDMVAAMVGILKTGAAYLPIDPAYPQDRIDYMLKDSNAYLLLKSEIRNSKFETNPNVQNTNDPNKNHCFPCTVLNFDSLEGHLRRGLSAFEFRASDLSPSGLIYIIYTSGSTGWPKGVMLQHRNIINFIEGMMETVDFSA
ncbi:MAG: AMP-binding protein, partial [bacterium]|nr:AMP-binding protein [bacterium]